MCSIVLFTFGGGRREAAQGRQEGAVLPRKLTHAGMPISKCWPNIFYFYWNVGFENIQSIFCFLVAGGDLRGGTLGRSPGQSSLWVLSLWFSPLLL